MVISTFEHDYPIVGVKQTGEVYDCYICRNISGGGLCRIMSIKDRSLFAELAGWLTDNINSDSFTDYIEHFIYEDRFCIVMKYTEGITLSLKLATESLPLQERLELGRRLLERIVLQDMPDYFLAKCFDPDCMVISSDLSVSFNYPVFDITEDRSANGRECIEPVFRLLFAKELERKVPDIIMDFIRRLPELSKERMIDLYGEYYDMMLKLEGYDENSEQPKTFWYKLWDKIKKIFNVLKKIVIIGLIIASVCYLIYTIIDPGKNTDNNGHFTSIGTVNIEKGSPDTSG